MSMLGGPVFEELADEAALFVRALKRGRGRRLTILRRFAGWAVLNGLCIAVAVLVAIMLFPVVVLIAFAPGTFLRIVGRWL